MLFLNICLKKKSVTQIVSSSKNTFNFALKKKHVLDTSLNCNSDTYTINLKTAGFMKEAQDFF